MGIIYQASNIHWNYFLAIESDFEKISRYVEFSEANNSTFSIELARIIMAGTQEIDGLMKKLCKLIRPGSDPQNIKHYRDIIKQDLPIITEEIVQIPRFGMSSVPWLNWQSNDDNNSPDWWIANNNIKHNRTENFEQANLKNAYNCVGALLMITLYYYKYKIESEQNQPINWQELTSMLKPKATLFTLRDDYYYEPGTWAGIEW
ncbi:hypothetical protein [Flavobacterium hydrophilum]|uniref:Uncharacterized protein n=1 Tax=Flavobacterium hydrophilum TaxID=2211445 RepID=A0A2V4C0B1_9FLAO|nr:hypothetical protein [Flavobacterium hydrophilum]PXY43573.1 hypothetical protein DMB68_18465 [Flavobacterium hydrophilum]